MIAQIAFTDVGGLAEVAMLGSTFTTAVLIPALAFVTVRLPLPCERREKIGRCF